MPTTTGLMRLKMKQTKDQKKRFLKMAKAFARHFRWRYNSLNQEEFKNWLNK